MTATTLITITFTKQFYKTTFQTKILEMYMHMPSEISSEVLSNN